MNPPYHIILADDDACLRTVIAGYLQQSIPSATISQVADGHAAIAAYEAHGADVLVTDHTMPGMSGIALVAVLRARRVTIPIVVHSGNANLEDEALAAGATRFVPKSEPLTTLVQAVLAL